MRKSLFTVSMLAVTLAMAPACASKKFVRTEVGGVNQKVDTLSTTVEETQERTRRNETRIGEVDQKAEAAAAKADAVDKATKKIVYEVALSEDSGNFKFGQAKLPDEAKAKIDEMINKVLADPKGSYFELEGHTDNVGAPEVNRSLGLQRAEAVKQYLYEQYHIPLHRINVISYGEDKPVSDNKTKDGRAQNRRVVIRVLG